MITRSFALSTLFFLALAPHANATCKSTIPGPPAQWDGHACGISGGGHCAPSLLPPAAPLNSASPLPSAASFTDLVNPMAACCGMGWVEDPDSGQKLDCVEAIAPTAPTYESFITFYNKEPSPDKITNANVAYPNRMFVLGRDGIPLNGFYRPTGARCPYRNPTTKNNITLTATQQMSLFDEALLESKPPTPSTAIPTAEVDPSCCNLVIFALERRCPISDTIGGEPVAVTTGSTRRCTAAIEMKLDFAVIDICDPTITKRVRFRTATSYRGEKPEAVTYTVTNPIEISNLVQSFYPKPAPSASPAPAPASCPSALFYEVPWTNGACRLVAPEPAPSPAL